MSEDCVSGRPRYSATPLPPYSYVPGHAPHPVSNPRGHMYGRARGEAAPPLLPDQWQDSDCYLYGFDLFNHGFYWEAHEAWESLWHAAGREGPVADWLKALIKLAAAAVKLREGNAAGVRRHAERSLALVQSVEDARSPGQKYCGVALADVRAIAESLVAEAMRGIGSPAPTRVLDGWLRLKI